MTEALTLAEVETRIHDMYRFFHTYDPSIYPNPDQGELGALWSLFDKMVASES